MRVRVRGALAQEGGELLAQCLQAATNDVGERLPEGLRQQDLAELGRQPLELVAARDRHRGNVVDQHGSRRRQLRAR